MSKSYSWADSKYELRRDTEPASQTEELLAVEDCWGVGWGESFSLEMKSLVRCMYRHCSRAVCEREVSSAGGCGRRWRWGGRGEYD